MTAAHEFYVGMGIFMTLGVAVITVGAVLMVRTERRRRELDAVSADAWARLWAAIHSDDDFVLNDDEAQEFDRIVGEQR
jgi:hypothetical protein